MVSTTFFLALAASLAAASPQFQARDHTNTTTPSDASADRVANDHPTVNPATDMQGVNSILAEWFPPASIASITPWEGPNADWVPEGCQKQVEKYNLSASDLTVLSVTYADCSEPWLLCRHKRSELSAEETAAFFGRLPIGVRSLVRHFIAAPRGGALAKIGGLFFPGANDILVTGTSSMNVLLHEASHAVDWVMLKGSDPTSVNGVFSEGDVWNGAYALDAAVPTDYARTNWRENFAEVGVLGMLDRVVYGGVPAYQPSWANLAHQIAAFKAAVGDAILPGGGRVCGARVENSQPVKIASSGNSTAVLRSGGARRRAAAGSKAPDVSFKDTTLGEIAVGSTDVEVDECHHGYLH